MITTPNEDIIGSPFTCNYKYVPTILKNNGVIITSKSNYSTRSEGLNLNLLFNSVIESKFLRENFIYPMTIFPVDSNNTIRIDYCES